MAKPGGIAGKLIKGLLLTGLVLAAAGLAGAWYVGAWNLVFPNTQHDTQAPSLPDDMQEPAILVFSKTNGFRHREGIGAGLLALKRIANEQGWSIYSTENGAVFNRPQLDRFSAVVFLSATGDMLDEAQELAFRQWLEAGGSWLGIHAAGDGSHKGWSWYVDNLIGAEFTAHILGPQFQVAKAEVEQRDHPAMRGLPVSWEHEEEWYSWEQSPRPRGFNILVTVDEDSYSPMLKGPGIERDLRMGDHPVVWSNCVGEGKTLYSALGHKAEAFEQPQHLQLLSSALAWLLDDDLACISVAGAGPFSQ